MRAERKTFGHARRLRRDLSLPEVILWDCLRHRRLRGLRFRRQHPVGPYAVLAIFHAEREELAVEVARPLITTCRGEQTRRPRREHCTLVLGASILRVMRIVTASDITDERALEGMLVTIAEAARGQV